MIQKRTLEELLEDWLDSTAILPDGRVYKVKGYVDRVRDLKIYVYAGDHNPPHFHVKSTQRDIDAKFHLHTRELYKDKTGKITTKDIKKVTAFFACEAFEKKLLDEYTKMQQK